MAYNGLIILKTLKFNLYINSNLNHILMFMQWRKHSIQLKGKTSNQLYVINARTSLTPGKKVSKRSDSSKKDPSLINLLKNSLT